MSSARIAAAVVFFSILFAAAAPAEAQSKREAPPSDAEVSRRLAFLEARLSSGTAASNRWWNAWFYGWTAFSVTQGAVALATTDRGLRIDMAVGAVSSSLGVIPLAFFPLPSLRAAQKLDALPSASADERRRKLARGEQLLKESAEAEVLGRSWFNHALGGVVSLGFGLVLGFAYKRPVSGVINTIGGIALTELQIWTQPTAAIADYRAYQAMSLGGAPKAASRGAGVTLRLSDGGLGLSGWF